MRTLSNTLWQAQRKADRLPYITAEIRDYEQGIKRLTWIRLYQGSEPDNHHGIAFDGQGSMHRLRAAADNKLYHQKITSPGLSSDYSQWTQIATDCAGPCAIAACGHKIYIFYCTTSNTIWKHYSHDYGESWTNSQLVDYPEASHLCASWRATTPTVVCFAMRLFGGTVQLNAITLDTDAQETTEHRWSDATHSLIEPLGIGATYDPNIPGHAIVLAGKEQDSPYDHYDLFCTRFSNQNLFTPLQSFIMAPEGEDTSYQFPDCHLPHSPRDYETTRIVAVEKFTGTTAYTRLLTCRLVKGTSWSDTTLTEPKPFLDIQPTYGLRLQSTTDYWWLSKPDGVWRAPREVEQALILTSDATSGQILSLVQRTDEGSLVLTLDNSRGQYASLGQGQLAQLRLGSELLLKLGYKTSQGNEASQAGTYWIDAWQYSSQPSLSLFTIYAIDGWRLMEKWSARYQMRWNKDQTDPTSVWQILYQLLARVGIKLSNTPPKPQSSAINNFYPDFAVNPGTKGDAALKRLLSFVPDQLVFSGQEAFTKDPRADETSCYSYGIDHAILAGWYGEATRVSHARVIGRDPDGARIVREALDWDLIDLGIDIIDQDYDPNLQTTTRAQERADAILRKHSLQANRAQITVPTNVGQEPLDVVEVTDARCGVHQLKYRVLSIQTTYDRREGRYEQKLWLCRP